MAGGLGMDLDDARTCTFTSPFLLYLVYVQDVQLVGGHDLEKYQTASPAYHRL